MKLTSVEIYDLVRYVYAALVQENKIEPLPVEVVDSVSARYYEQSTVSGPLRPGEQAIVTFTKPKSAALFADRVWSVGSLPPVEDAHMTFGWEIAMDVRWRAMFDLAYLDAETKRCAHEIDNAPPGGTPEFMRWLEGIARDFAADYRLRGMTVSPLYDSAEVRDTEYRRGDRAAFLASADNLNLVDEDRLNWEQVKEFRDDSDARIAYRMFIHWLETAMVGKSASFIADEITSRLERYEWALRKHGIQTVLGTLERIINPGMLAGASAISASIQFITNQPIWSLVAGAGFTVAGVALSLSKVLLERKDIEIGQRDIAYVQQVKARLGGR